MRARDSSGVGRYSFHEYPEPEVMTLEEAATFLRLTVEELSNAARSGQVPARSIGESWRFSRTALVNWLSGATEPTEARPPT